MNFAGRKNGGIPERGPAGVFRQVKVALPQHPTGKKCGYAKKGF